MVDFQVLCPGGRYCQVGLYSRGMLRQLGKESWWLGWFRQWWMWYWQYEEPHLGPRQRGWWQEQTPSLGTLSWGWSPVRTLGVGLITELARHHRYWHWKSSSSTQSRDTTTTPTTAKNRHRIVAHAQSAMVKSNLKAVVSFSLSSTLFRPLSSFSAPLPLTTFFTFSLQPLEPGCAFSCLNGSRLNSYRMGDAPTRVTSSTYRKRTRPARAESRSAVLGDLPRFPLNDLGPGSWIRCKFSLGGPPASRELGSIDTSPKWFGWFANLGTGQGSQGPLKVFVRVEGKARNLVLSRGYREPYEVTWSRQAHRSKARG